MPELRVNGHAYSFDAPVGRTLAETLREALRIERPRRATKPTRSAVEKRLDQKRRRGETKRLRRPPD